LNDHHIRIIKASEIGVYDYCQRAWWYQKQGARSENHPALQSGTQFHESHAKGIILTNLLRYIAIGLIVLSSLFFALYFLFR